MNLVVTGEVTLGFRPENFLPKASFAENIPVTNIAFNIHRVEYLGGDRLLYGMVSGNLPETAVIARIPSSVHYSPILNTEVPFAVANSELRRFDTASGKAIVAEPMGTRRTANG
jgi:multiple sugar transport system ATP-binding protein